LKVGVTLITLSAYLAAARDVAVPDDSGFSQSWDRVNVSHALWDQVLKAHVDKDGLVDYCQLRDDARFKEYLFRVARTNPAELPSSDARRAYWINAYNAFVIQGVLETLPVDERKWADYSVLRVDVDGTTEPGEGFFDGLKFVAGGRRYSLNEIEKGILLGRPGAVGAAADAYKSVAPDVPDARVHMAVVCASRGCPRLSRAAFEADTVNDQLRRAVTEFAGDQTRCRFDRSQRRVEISKLFEWYAGDFSNPGFRPHAASVYEFLARHVDDEELGRSLRNDRWTMVFLPWDWSLNVQR